MNTIPRTVVKYDGAGKIYVLRASMIVNIQTLKITRARATKELLTPSFGVLDTG